MREFGWTIPVLLDELGEIIAGAGRAAARLDGRPGDDCARLVGSAQMRLPHRRTVPGRRLNAERRRELGSRMLGLEIEPRYVKFCIMR
jgi:hypothetical protein